MLVLCDIYELLDLISPLNSVSVVQGKLRYEWPSLMCFSNSLCKKLTPQWIGDENNHPQSLEWGTVGSLPPEYNHCVGYDEPNRDAKVIHFTQGIPIFPETKDSEHAEAWLDEFKMTRASVSWQEIMGKSIHAKPVLERAHGSN